jgi:hypothetical protein
MAGSRVIELREYRARTADGRDVAGHRAGRGGASVGGRSGEERNIMALRQADCRRSSSGASRLPCIIGRANTSRSKGLAERMT